jgi:hypothetical protein
VKVAIAAVGRRDRRNGKPSLRQEEETMTSQTLRLPRPSSIPAFRPNRRYTDRVGRRPGRLERSDSGAEGTPVLRLVGAALLGWFGLMIVVTVLAV